MDAFNEKDPYKADDARDEDDESDDNDNNESALEAEPFPLERDDVMPPPLPHPPPTDRVSFPKGLPWAPKVRYIHMYSSSPYTTKHASVHTQILTQCVFCVEQREGY